MDDFLRLFISMIMPTIKLITTIGIVTGANKTNRNHLKIVFELSENQEITPATMIKDMINCIT